MDTSQPTRDRILDAAMILFGERGYRGTTVGAIEQAAGLAPRRGGLYRHFPSKQEVFKAAVSRYASKFRSLEDLLDALDFDDERATLTRLAQFALAGLAAEADLFRLLQRDGPDFPDLTMLVHEQQSNAATTSRSLRSPGCSTYAVCRWGTCPRWPPSLLGPWSSSAKTRRSTARRQPAHRGTIRGNLGRHLAQSPGVEPQRPSSTAADSVPSR